jgi:hypothetical protein
LVEVMAVMAVSIREKAAGRGAATTGGEAGTGGKIGQPTNEPSGYQIEALSL